MVQSEGDQPPAGEQQPDRHGGARPPQGAGPRHGNGGIVAPADAQRRVADPRAAGLDDGEDGRTAQGIHARDDARRHRPARTTAPPRCRPSLTAHAKSPRNSTARERLGVRVFPGQRREQVPAVDGEGVVEQERQGRGRQEGGNTARSPKIGRMPTHRSAGGPTEDRPQLECDSVGDDPAGDGDEEIGNGEVEGVRGKPSYQPGSSP